jgi:hypothetical protein
MRLEVVRMNERDDHARWHNSPARFNDTLTPAEQLALRRWVATNLEPARRGSRQRLSSYWLKHRAEEALHWYVGNGVMKGAMLAEGYDDYTPWGDREHPDINWDFAVRRRVASEAAA